MPTQPPQSPLHKRNNNKHKKVTTLGDLKDHKPIFSQNKDPKDRIDTVSYTHLTLPTIYSV